MSRGIQSSTNGDMMRYKTEVLAGITVSLALVPEALAFSIIAGVPPTVGLYAAFVLGVISSCFGGRPGMISGATGAVSVGLAPLMQSHGIEYLFAAVILAGVIQVLVGVFKFNKFIRLVSRPVNWGFVNGLAIIIFFSQAKQFKWMRGDREEWLSGEPLYAMLGLAMLTILTIIIFPKITKVVPAALAAIILIYALVGILSIPTKTVGDIASIHGGFPPFHIANVPFNFETLRIVLPYSIVMAGVGLIESLLTVTLVDEITSTKGNSRKESIIQGCANITSGFFTGMGGCAMTGQTIVNLWAGGRSRLSGIIASSLVLAFVMFAAPVIERIPMAALVGMMIMVAYKTFNWTSLQKIRHIPVSDFIIMVLVVFVTILYSNLALGAFVGVVISGLILAWRSGQDFSMISAYDWAGAKTYTIHGTLSFASAASFSQQLDIATDPAQIFIDFKYAQIIDVTAAETLSNSIWRYEKVGKSISLINLDNDSLQIMKKTASLFLPLQPGYIEEH